MIKVRCPICDRVIEGQGPAEWPQFPFCSARCRLVDLGRWLGEGYRIAASRAEEEAPAQHGDDSDNP
jgi:endogenous inhibitor of DNA gyrase (YacG/DUF329 family)